MFIFVLNQMHKFVDALSVIGGLDIKFDVKFSQQILSIISTPSRGCRYMIALQLFPPFFTDYFCPQLHYLWFEIARFVPVASCLDRNGYTTLTFSFPIPDHADLTFEAPNRPRREVDFPLYPSNGLKDVGEFDWTTFVSITSQEFINIVTSLHVFDYVRVTLTRSQVKFSCSTAEIILTPQRRKCIIGGVAGANEIRFNITLHPMVNFCNLASKAQRVWLFKSNNSNKGVISAPIGLQARFLVYYPDVIIV